MADEIKASLGVETKLIAGSGGIFDVVVDGKTVYTKSKTGRFPNPGETVEILKSTCP